MGKVSKKILIGSGKAAKHAAKFTLSLLADALKFSAKEKEYEATQHEIACGEKLPFNDEYFVPDDKHPK